MIAANDTGVSLDEAARRVLEHASRREYKIATAESCTGGLISSLLTDVDGLSHAFERGFTAYSDEAKTQLLGIPPELIATAGAVSRAVAKEMAQGALATSQADIAISVTGFAGPAGPDDEVGRVHLACIRRGGAMIERELHLGNTGRTAIRNSAAHTALNMLEQAMIGE